MIQDSFHPHAPRTFQQNHVALSGHFFKALRHLRRFLTNPDPIPVQPLGQGLFRDDGREFPQGDETVDSKGNDRSADLSMRLSLRRAQFQHVPQNRDPPTVTCETAQGFQCGLDGSRIGIVDVLQ